MIDFINHLNHFEKRNLTQLVSAPILQNNSENSASARFCKDFHKVRAIRFPEEVFAVSPNY